MKESSKLSFLLFWSHWVLRWVYKTWVEENHRITSHNHNSVNNTFGEAIVSLNTLKIQQSNVKITLHLFIAAITLHLVGVHWKVQGRQSTAQEMRWKQRGVSGKDSGLCSLLYFSRRTWDSTKKKQCCKQTKQTNYTVGPRCDTALTDGDVHQKLWEISLFWAPFWEHSGTIFKLLTIYHISTGSVRSHVAWASLSVKRWVVAQR